MGNILSCFKKLGREDDLIDKEIKIDWDAGYTSEELAQLFKDEYKRMTVKATGVHFHFSWGRGTEGSAELAQSKKLAAAGKIKTYTT